jgi:hypothetical protein
VMTMSPAKLSKYMGQPGYTPSSRPRSEPAAATTVSLPMAAATGCRMATLRIGAEAPCAVTLILTGQAILSRIKELPTIIAGRAAIAQLRVTEQLETA